MAPLVPELTRGRHTMPITSTTKQFVDGLKERRSATTKALDALFRTPKKLAGRLPDLQKPGYLAGPLPKWIRDDLKAHGAKKQREITHIDEWPKGQKEDVRKALVHAIEKSDKGNSIRVRFFWVLSGLINKEETIIEPKRLPNTGTITITFVSPQKRVRVSTAAETFGHIFVDVGP